MILDMFYNADDSFHLIQQWMDAIKITSMPHIIHMTFQGRCKNVDEL